MARGHVGKDRRVDLLQDVWLFSNCTRKELSRIAEIASPMEIGAGKVLVQEGSTGQEFFVVVSGTATVSRNGVPFGSIDEGSFFGEMALLDGGPRTATVTADVDMLVLIMTRKEFNQYLAEVVPSVAQRMLMVLGARLRRAEEILDLTDGSLAPGGDREISV